MSLNVNLPGGVIAQLDDGRTEYLAYGQPVPDNLAPHVDPSTFADTEARVNYADIAQQANARAALDEKGQPGSSSSSVPGNYGELDESTVIKLIGSLEPRQQYEILLHEKANGQNRQAITDAASPEARQLLKSAVEGPDEPAATEDAGEATDDAGEASGDDAEAKAAPKGRSRAKTPPPSSDE